MNSSMKQVKLLNLVLNAFKIGDEDTRMTSLLSLLLILSSQ